MILVSGVPGSGQAAHTLPQAMEQAGDFYNAGEFAKAEHVCRSILRAQADYVDAMSLLGAIAAQTGRTAEAAELFRSVAQLATRKDAAR